MVYKGIIKIEINSRIRLYKSRIRWKRRRAESMGLSVQYRDFVAADAEKCIEHGAMGRGHGAWGHGA
jgi:hypothetical protein